MSLIFKNWLPIQASDRQCQVAQVAQNKNHELGGVKVNTGGHGPMVSHNTDNSNENAIVEVF